MKFDVIEVDLDSKAVRVIETDKAEKNANAVRDMAVMRRGVEKSIFVVVPAGRYKDHETYGGFQHV